MNRPRQTRSGPLAASIPAAAVLAACILAPPAIAAPASGPPANGLEEIVVTATKTGETALQSTPIAIDAFSADQLASRGIENISGVVGLTPGVQLSDLTGYSQLFIRGVGSNTVFIGSDPSSTVHLDGVYLARPLSFLTDFLDVDRVEVVKGPQGTLYGRNSVGGTVNVISRTPSATPTGEVALSAGNYSEFSAQGYLSGPLGDSGLRASLAVNRLTHGPYLDNVSTGGGVETQDHYGARGQLLIPIGSAAALTLRGDYSFANDALGGAPKLLVQDHVPLDDSVFGDFHRVSLNLPNLTTLRTWGVAADLSVQATDALTVRSLTAYRHFSGSIDLDADSSSLNVLRTLVSPIAQHQFSEELTANGKAGNLDFVAGAYYFTENDAEPLTLAVPGFGVSNVVRGQLTDESEAAFAQLEYHFTPQLSAVAGLRYTHETKDYAVSSAWTLSASFDPAVAAAAPTIGPPFFPAPFAISTSRADGAWTPKLGLNFQARDNMLVYASVTRGFKSGGFDYGAPDAADALRGYQPEYLWSYELGLKSDWLDRRLRVNLDAFLYRFSDLQVEVFVPPANAVTENAATARIEGLEAQLEMRPIPELNVYANLAWLHARYTAYPGAFVTAFGNFDATGKALNHAPDFTLVTGVLYTTRIASGASLFIGADYHWQAQQFFTPANDGVGAVTGYPEQQASFGVLGARLGWKSPDERWTAALVGSNLTNQDYVTGTVSYGVGIAGRPGDPRTVRGELAYKF